MRGPRRGAGVRPKPSLQRRRMHPSGGAGSDLLQLTLVELLDGPHRGIQTTEPNQPRSHEGPDTEGRRHSENVCRGVSEAEANERAVRFDRTSSQRRAPRASTSPSRPWWGRRCRDSTRSRASRRSRRPSSSTSAPRRRTGARSRSASKKRERSVDHSSPHARRWRRARRTYAGPLLHGLSMSNSSAATRGDRSSRGRSRPGGYAARVALAALAARRQR